MPGGEVVWCDRIEAEVFIIGEKDKDDDRIGDYLSSCVRAGVRVCASLQCRYACVIRTYGGPRFSSPPFEIWSTDA